MIPGVVAQQAMIVAEEPPPGGAGVGAHRYWGIRMVNPAHGQPYCAIGNIRFVTEPGATKLHTDTSKLTNPASILGSPVWGPSTAWTDADNTPDTKAWLVPNANPDADRTCGYDFDVPIVMREVRIKPPHYSLDYATDSYDILYSDDGTTWTTVEEVRGANFTSVDEERTHPIEQIAIAAQYWGLRVIANNGQAYVMIARIEFADEAAGARINTDSNNITNPARIGVFGNAAAYAWGSYEMPAMGGIDRWMEETVSMPFIQAYNFGADVEPVEMRMRSIDAGGNGAYGVKDFDIIFSDDGSAWSTSFQARNQSWVNDLDIKTYSLV